MTLSRKKAVPSPAAASASQNGEGVFVRDMYLSDAKMAELKINLHDLMGREVKIFYNEYRKPENIVVLD